LKIIKPTFEVITPFGPLSKYMGERLLRFIEAQARISHRSEDKQTRDSWRKFIQMVCLDRGDLSVIEHANLTVHFRVDRGVMAELTRHRTLSFTIESTRFVNYKKQGELEFVEPIEFQDKTKFTKVWPWEQSIAESERAYLEMVERGIRPQEARSVLPNALATTISATGNLRTWRHVLLLRTTREAHPDMRNIMIPLLKELQEKVPLIFDDIEPNARQIENMRKAR
jgi:thymidylate synthase (FAD)